MSYYNIDSADGNSITQGIQSEVEARRAAQRMANERGESVYLYEVGPGDGESEVDSEEIAPEADDDDAGTPSLSEALAWAETAQPGEYLVEYADTGLTDAEDPGSRCGYGDSELDAIRAALDVRDMTLTADDTGLVAAERK